MISPYLSKVLNKNKRTDLPEFIAWALIYQAEAGEVTNVPLALTLAASIVNPALRARAAALQATQA